MDSTTARGMPTQRKANPAGAAAAAEPPSLGGFYVSVAGQVEGAEMKGADYLFCRYSFATGPDWRPVQGIDHGASQVAVRASFSPSVVWNLPIEMTFKSTNPFGWPRLVITVFSQDFLGRFVVRGYGSLLLPSLPGRHVRLVPCFAPVSSTLLQGFLGWLTGTVPEFYDAHFVAGGEGRDVTRVAPAGMVRVSLNVVTRGLAVHGYATGSPHDAPALAMAASAPEAQASAADGEARAARAAAAAAQQQTRASSMLGATTAGRGSSVGSGGGGGHGGGGLGGSSGATQSTTGGEVLAATRRLLESSTVTLESARAVSGGAAAQYGDSTRLGSARYGSGGLGAGAGGGSAGATAGRSAAMSPPSSLLPTGRSKGPAHPLVESAADSSSSSSSSSSAYAPTGDAPAASSAPAQQHPSAAGVASYSSGAAAAAATPATRGVAAAAASSQRGARRRAPSAANAVAAAPEPAQPPREDENDGAYHDAQPPDDEGEEEQGGRRPRADAHGGAVAATAPPSPQPPPPAVAAAMAPPAQPRQSRRVSISEPPSSSLGEEGPDSRGGSRGSASDHPRPDSRGTDSDHARPGGAPGPALPQLRPSARVSRRPSDRNALLDSSGDEGEPPEETAAAAAARRRALLLTAPPVDGQLGAGGGGAGRARARGSTGTAPPGPPAVFMQLPAPVGEASRMLGAPVRGTGVAPLGGSGGVGGVAASAPGRGSASRRILRDESAEYEE